MLKEILKAISLNVYTSNFGYRVVIKFIKLFTANMVKICTTITKDNMHRLRV